MAKKSLLTVEKQRFEQGGLKKVNALEFNYQNQHVAA